MSSALVDANKDSPNFGFTVTVPNAGVRPVAGLDLTGQTVCGVYVPAEYDGTTLKFEAAATLGGTYLPVYGTDGVEVSYTVAASRYVPLDPAVFAGIRYLKPVTPTQTGASVLAFATRRLG